MRTNAPAPKGNDHYKIKDDTIAFLVVEATDLFHVEKEKKDFTQSKAKLEEAIVLARKNLQTSTRVFDRYDLAYLLRRYASILIRDFTYPEHCQKAKAALEEALQIHRSNHYTMGVIDIEKARILYQLRNVAYELRDGELLESVAKELVDFLQSARFPKNTTEMRFLEDAYESLFHVHFARKELKEVIDILSLDCFRQHTRGRHRAKLCLARMILGEVPKDGEISYFSQKVEGHFWESFDFNKKNFISSFEDDTISRKQAKGALKKDLMFLFVLRCQKSLLGNDKGERPMEYVLRHAKKLFPDRYSFYMLSESLDLTSDLKKSILQNDLLVIKKSENFFLIYCKLKSSDQIRAIKISEYSSGRELFDILMKFEFNNTVYCPASFSSIFKALSPLVQLCGEMPRVNEDGSYTKLKQDLEIKISSVNDSGKLPLDYQYFSDYDPISIPISLEQFETLFSGYLVGKISGARDGLFSSGSSSESDAPFKGNNEAYQFDY